MTYILLAGDGREADPRYIGCYKDAKDRRQLPKVAFTFGTEISPETCIRTCNGHAKRYAGVEVSANQFF